MMLWNLLRSLLLHLSLFLSLKRHKELDVDDIMNEKIDYLIGMIYEYGYDYKVIPVGKVNKELKECFDNQEIGGYCDYNIKTIFVTEYITNNPRLHLAILIHEIAHMIEEQILVNTGNQKIYDRSIRHDRTGKIKLYFIMREMRVTYIGNYIRQMLNVDDIISEKGWIEWLRKDRKEKGFNY